MDTQNVTFRVPKALVAEVKRVAAERGVSMTALVVESLAHVASGNDAYQAARERQLALMRSGRRLRNEGADFTARGEVHER